MVWKIWTKSIYFSSDHDETCTKILTWRKHIIIQEGQKLNQYSGPFFQENVRLQQHNLELERRNQAHAEEVNILRCHINYPRRHTMAFIIDQNDTYHQLKDTQV